MEASEKETNGIETDKKERQMGRRNFICQSTFKSEFLQQKYIYWQYQFKHLHKRKRKRETEGLHKNTQGGSGGYWRVYKTIAWEKEVRYPCI